MKKTMLLFAAIMLSGMLLSAQTDKGKIEVLYFKANLACCKARSCNALQGDLQKLIDESFPDGSVVLKEVKLADTTNNAIIKKYNAQSQTVIIVNKSKKKEVSIDITSTVKDYVKSQDKVVLQKELAEKIGLSKKKKK